MCVHISDDFHPFTASDARFRPPSLILFSLDVVAVNRLQEFLLHAGRDLGVQVIAPYAVMLPSGEEIVVDAWLPQLGAPNGMLVLSASDVAWRLQSVATEHGYGVTSYLEPPATELYDVAAYAEMFAEWDWNAQNSTRPPITVPSDAPSNI